MEILDKLIKTFAFWYYWLTILYVIFHIIALYAKYRYDSIVTLREKKPYDLSFTVTIKSIILFSLWLACKAIL